MLAFGVYPLFLPSAIIFLALRSQYFEHLRSLSPTQLSLRKNGQEESGLLNLRRLGSSRFFPVPHENDEHDENHAGKGMVFQRHGFLFPDKICVCGRFGTFVFDIFRTLVGILSQLSSSRLSTDLPVQRRCNSVVRTDT